MREYWMVTCEEAYAEMARMEMEAEKLREAWREEEEKNFWTEERINDFNEAVLVLLEKEEA